MHRLIRRVTLSRAFLDLKFCSSKLPIARCARIREFSNASGVAGSTGEGDGSSFYDEDYQTFTRGTEARLGQILNSPTRYQPIQQREDRSDVPQSAIANICLGKYITSYRGAIFVREPNELQIFRHMFACLQPRTVIELGTFTGASAVWFGDNAALLNLDCHVYSTDDDHSLISEEIKKVKPENVTFIEGDRNRIENVFPSSLLQSLPHPWLVIEDSHDDLFVGFKYLNDFMSEGDYVVVQNNDPRMPLRRGLHVLYNKEEMVPLGPGNLELLRSFLKEHGQKYQVDSFYTDLYGYNCTPHWHGFLRKM